MRHKICGIHNNPYTLYLTFSADPQFQSSVINTNVIVSSNGEVVWLSHGIYRSSCDINVEYFPFDLQSCQMKWASWTYDGYQVSVIFLLHSTVLLPSEKHTSQCNRTNKSDVEQKVLNQFTTKVTNASVISTWQKNHRITNICVVQTTNAISYLHTPFAEAKVSVLVSIRSGKHGFTCVNELLLLSELPTTWLIARLI